jgi:hypothetical protein
MAKKPAPTPVVNLSPFERKYADNNPDGPFRKPSYSTDPSDASYVNTFAAPGKKIHFPSMVAKGESANAGDVNHITANGISNSRNTGRGVQYNWGDGLSGRWNKNDDWDGGNISGL